MNVISRNKVSAFVKVACPKTFTVKIFLSLSKRFNDYFKVLLLPNRRGNYGFPHPTPFLGSPSEEKKYGLEVEFYYFLHHQFNKSAGTVYHFYISPLSIVLS